MSFAISNISSPINLDILIPKEALFQKRTCNNKSCHGLPAELAARQVVKEASRTRGLKDDTTCIVVDVIPPDNSAPPSPPPKKQNRFRALLFRKRSHDSASKLSRKLSAVGIVEELFEEGSAMLAERFDTCRNSLLSF
ncbi:PPM-type phosphatase domain-containing protein [Heracleum sosnowskyi]|uniref:PPM-type phosphatase domain-containing protein n=1 Tax=Heracleum sosnowskyi TaxID=360622 RepID=A0AAD8J1J7_9APIA|nr:PPM-type phosphatase domain-containing protein [Heracleum sosnowskyi]